jgi:hypothetical protein
MSVPGYGTQRKSLIGSEEIGATDKAVSVDASDHQQTI